VVILEIPAAGERGRMAAVSELAEVPFVHADANAAVVSRVAVDDRPRPVGRVIVAHDQLEIATRLREDALDRRADVALAVVHREQHADRRSLDHLAARMAVRTRRTTGLGIHGLSRRDPYWRWRPGVIGR